jgi:hypothetical protein
MTLCDPALNPVGVVVVSWYKYQSSESPIKSLILSMDNPLLFLETMYINGLASHVGKYSIFPCIHDHVMTPLHGPPGGYTLRCILNDRGGYFRLLTT